MNVKLNGEEGLFFTEEVLLLSVGGIREIEDHPENTVIIIAAGKVH